MFELSSEGLSKVKSELTRYEDKMSAIIPALYVAQKKTKAGSVKEVIGHLSKVMDIPASRINEVFKFYTMFNQKPVENTTFRSARLCPARSTKAESLRITSAKN